MSKDCISVTVTDPKISMLKDCELVSVSDLVLKSPVVPGLSALSTPMSQGWGDERYMRQDRGGSTTRELRLFVNGKLKRSFLLGGHSLKLKRVEKLL